MTGTETEEGEGLLQQLAALSDFESTGAEVRAVAQITKKIMFFKTAIYCAAGPASCILFTTKRYLFWSNFWRWDAA